MNEKATVRFETMPRKQGPMDWGFFEDHLVYEDGISIGAVLGDVNRGAVLSASALAAVLSLLTSVAGLPEVNGGA